MVGTAPRAGEDRMRRGTRKEVGNLLRGRRIVCQLAGDDRVCLGGFAEHETGTGAESGYHIIPI